jgi:hypothetical protein
MDRRIHCLHYQLLPPWRRRFYLLLALGVLLSALYRTPALAQTNSTSAELITTEHSEATRAAALTENDTVVLTDFINKTGDTVFDNSLEQALAIELGQSPFLSMLSDRKVSEALRMMGSPANEPITPEVGRELCLRTGSTVVLGGTISNLRDHYLLELTAVACGSGDTLAKEQDEALSKKDVLKALS